MIYQQMFEETEMQVQKNNNNIARKIINELERKCNVKFLPPNSSLTYPMVIQTILFIPTYREYRNKLIELLDKYKVCERNIILRYLSIINQPEMPEDVKNTIERSFYGLPYFKSYEKSENGCIIETKYGTIEAHNLMSLLNEEKLYKLIKQNRYRQLCHLAVEECIPYYPNHCIVTSEIPAIFKGNYYHSYYKSSDNKDVVDIASNILYKNNTFDNFYKPTELLNIKAKNLDKEYQKINKYIFPTEMAKTLELALENKRKNI